ETQINTFNSRYSPKYFGLDKGVSACTLVANHVPINAKIIGTHERRRQHLYLPSSSISISYMNMRAT
ncbi:MAG: Tn3 family transposase, partial [Rhodoferax sp.]|nr:Tn3 family transposase [Rhodoferax sp.]